MVVGYKYNYWKLLWFISTEGYGSTYLGDTYLSCLPDTYSNVSIFPVVCPSMLGRYFNSFNNKYQQNKMWQYYLALDVYWETQSDCVRLATAVTLVAGITYEHILLCCGISEKNRDKKSFWSSTIIGQCMTSSTILLHFIVVYQILNLLQWP